MEGCVCGPDKVKVSEDICSLRKSICAFVKVNVLMCSRKEEIKPYLTGGGWGWTCSDRCQRDSVGGKRQTFPLLSVYLKENPILEHIQYVWIEISGMGWVFLVLICWYGLYFCYCCEKLTVAYCSDGRKRYYQCNYNEV